MELRLDVGVSLPEQAARTRRPAVAAAAASHRKCLVFI
jgi:hypothetical protein